MCSGWRERRKHWLPNSGVFGQVTLPLCISLFPFGNGDAGTHLQAVGEARAVLCRYYLVPCQGAQQPLAAHWCALWCEGGPSQSECRDPCTVVLHKMEPSWPKAVSQGFSTRVLRLQGPRDWMGKRTFYFMSTKLLLEILAFLSVMGECRGGSGMVS